MELGGSATHDGGTAAAIDVAEGGGDLPGGLLVDADGPEDGVTFALHLAVAGAVDAGGGDFLLVAVVVALGLGCEEAADAHGDCASNEFRDAAEDDEFRLAEGREACGKRERDGQAVGETNHAVY